MPPNAKQSKVNTYLSIVGFLLTIGAILWGTHKYLVPIETMPRAIEKMETTLGSQSKELDQVAKTQLVQTQALQILAEVAKDSKDLRRDVDKHDIEIDVIQEKLKELKQ